MGVETAAAIKKLASMIAEKRNELYSHTIALLRLRINFALLKTAIVCLRGTGSKRQLVERPSAPSDVILHELRVEQ